MKAKRNYNNTRREANSIAGPCTACQALLPLANPPREQSTREYARKGRIAYCRCDNCGRTWKTAIAPVVPDVVHAAAILEIKSK